MNNTKKPEVAANLGVALMQLAHSPSAAAPKQTCDGGGGNQQYMCQGMGGLEPLLLQLDSFPFNDNCSVTCPLHHNKSA